MTLQSYRKRWGHAPGASDYAAAEAGVRTTPPIAVPTLVIRGAPDRCNDPSTSLERASFTGSYRRLELPGVGHFPQREAAASVVEAILAALAQAA